MGLIIRSSVKGKVAVFFWVGLGKVAVIAFEEIGDLNLWDGASYVNITSIRCNTESMQICPTPRPSLSHAARSLPNLKLPHFDRFSKFCNALWSRPAIQSYFGNSSAAIQARTSERTVCWNCIFSSCRASKNTFTPTSVDGQGKKVTTIDVMQLRGAKFSRNNRSGLNSLAAAWS